MKYCFQLDKIPGYHRNIPHARLSLMASLTKNHHVYLKVMTLKRRVDAFFRPTGDLINDTSLKLVEKPLEKHLTSLYYKESISLPNS